MKTIGRFVLLLAVLVAGTGLAEEFRYTNAKVTTFQSSGPPASKIDIVFLGDGYTNSQRREFDSDIESCLNILWGVSPFRELKDRFNVYAVYVDAKKLHSYDSQGRPRVAYPFGSEYAGKTRARVNLTRSGFVKVAASNAPEADIVVVLTTLSGRSNAGSYIVIADDADVLAHELGHEIGGLGDEYSSRNRTGDRERHRGKSLSRYPNLQEDSTIDPTSEETLRKTAKWRHFFDLPDAWPTVSAYQGGYYREVGVWRPSYSCVMRNSGGSVFCPVCHEQVYKSILAQSGEKFDHKSYHLQFPLSLWKSKFY